jgi:hypothetical protein
MKEYKVGQIIYKLSSAGIVPLLVKEEITKVSLTGTQKLYVFLEHTHDIMSSDMKDIIFENLDDLKSYLFEKSKSNIEKLISSAEERTKTWYQSQNEMSSMQNVNHNDNEEEVLVTLPDGQVAKYKPKKLE